MTDTVLTSEEIVKLVCATDAQGQNQRFAYASFARAVERAVLAKMRAERDFLPPTEREAQAAYLNAKWEREARVRERAAFEAGARRTRWEMAIAPQGSGPADRDALYPLPTCAKCGQTLP